MKRRKRKKFERKKPTPPKSKRKRPTLDKYKKEYKGWIKVTCQAICGCCQSVFLFKTHERAEEACKEATNKHAEITDDTGNTEQVDGFYGFDLEKI